MNRSLERAWLHTIALYDTASPVLVLARGTKYATVRLKHRRRWNGKWEEAGQVVKVPLFALASEPRAQALVSVGRGKFVPRESTEAARMVEWFQPARVKSDRSTREKLSRMRDKGMIGRRANERGSADPFVIAGLVFVALLLAFSVWRNSVRSDECEARGGTYYCGYKSSCICFAKGTVLP